MWKMLFSFVCMLVEWAEAGLAHLACLAVVRQGAAGWLINLLLGHLQISAILTRYTPVLYDFFWAAKQLAGAAHWFRPTVGRSLGKGRTVPSSRSSTYSTSLPFSLAPTRIEISAFMRTHARYPLSTHQVQSHGPFKPNLLLPTR